MYHIMLVDDELPALRFLETIVEKYAPEFTVSASHRDGASALAWLKEHIYQVDLILTDIRMPDMDGIALAKAARALRRDLHIVIVSGYQEFEYAHGAIEASVDDYILKPVSVSHMKELLEKIRLQLDESRNMRISRELTSLLTAQTYDSAFLDREFGAGNYYFVLLRFGNVIYPLKPLVNAALLPLTMIPQLSSADQASEFDIRAITGHDDQEYLLFAPAAKASVAFQSAIRTMLRSAGISAATVIFSPGGIPFSSLCAFYPAAYKALRHTAVIGYYTELVFSSSNAGMKAPSARISPTFLKRLEICIREGDLSSIRQMLIDQGKEWDEKHVPQRQVYVMMHQLLHLAESLRESDYQSIDELILAADQLMNTASCYAGLALGLFTLLFSDEGSRNHPMRPEEMYQYAVRYIEEKFARPISIQTVCSEIGISQTYLSRLFRKYGDTSFNACLIKCRMDNAKKLLSAQPDMPLYQVAACVGYDDYAYFSKVFRQSAGCSPSRYQETLKKQASPAKD